MSSKIAIRADASLSLGSGHVRRCLTLADQLSGLHCEVTFFTNRINGNLISLIKSHGHSVKILSSVMLDFEENSASEVLPDDLQLADARESVELSDGQLYDWMVVDHYGLNETWQKFTRKIYKHLLVIDDLANKRHDCDLLVNQNLGCDVRDYKALVKGKTVTLCGPSYALLRSEFGELRAQALKSPRTSELRSILIFMGGTDIGDITYSVLDALWMTKFKFLKNIYVVMGSGSTSISSVRTLLGKFNCYTELLVDTTEIHKYMLMSDLSIGAAGGAAWERCCMGLPSILITVAENQKKGTNALVKAGAAKAVDFDVSANNSLIKAIKDFSSGDKLSVMSSKAASICDGAGVSRVFRHMCLIDKTLLVPRLATLEDGMLLLEWANDSVTRHNSIKKELISRENHFKWLADKLSNPQECIIYIVELPNGEPLGQIRFEKSGEAWSIDYSLGSSHRGQGFGEILLNTGLRSLSKHYSGEIVSGIVKSENLASIRVFEKCLFDRLKIQTDGFVYFEKVI